MKLFFITITLFFTSVVNAQIPKSGTYIYSYCDFEYNKCLSKCKVKIKGNKIWVYAPSNLSGIKEGELFESGTLSKHHSGKWTITNPQKNKSTNPSHPKDVLVWIEFSKKQFWTF